MSFAPKPVQQRQQPNLSPEQIAWLTQAIVEYVHVQRVRYLPLAASLSFSEVWSRFFPAIDLERIRVLQPGLERVANPPFYAELEKLGFSGLPDFSIMAAITYDEVVVFHEPLSPQLIFHEMVHVVQYRLLGIEEFARLYVLGYLHGGYEGTPLEMCAYQLDGRFIMGSVGFDVEAEVRGWIESGRF
ncbi:MAG: hypothetical protein WA655_23960 [Candidatus Korobacteraceae bacterium]